MSEIAARAQQMRFDDGNFWTWPDHYVYEQHAETDVIQPDFNGWYAVFYDGRMLDLSRNPMFFTYTCDSVSIDGAYTSRMGWSPGKFLKLVPGKYQFTCEWNATSFSLYVLHYQKAGDGYVFSTRNSFQRLNFDFEVVHDEIVCIMLTDRSAPAFMSTVTDVQVKQA